MFSIGSLVASIIGLIALTADVIAMLAWDTAGSPRLESVFIVADIVGFVCGGISTHSAAGRTGLHLSWAPLLAVLAVAATFRPQLSITLIQAIGGFLLDIADGLTEILVGVLA